MLLLNKYRYNYQIGRNLKSLIKYTLFFYKNLVYKNTKASNGFKIKNILRTYEGFISWEKNFASGDIKKT